jgi:hypothetical protein
MHSIPPVMRAGAPKVPCHLQSTLCLHQLLYVLARVTALAAPSRPLPLRSCKGIVALLSVRSLSALSYASRVSYMGGRQVFPWRPYAVAKADLHGSLATDVGAPDLRHQIRGQIALGLPAQSPLRPARRAAWQPIFLRIAESKDEATLTCIGPSLRSHHQGRPPGSIIANFAVICRE